MSEIGPSHQGRNAPIKEPILLTVFQSKAYQIYHQVRFLFYKNACMPLILPMVHKTANVLNKFPKSMQPTVKADPREIWQAETRAKAKAAMDIFAETYRTKYQKAVTCLAKDRDALLAFHDFPVDHWDHPRTRNPIESVFVTVRHRTVRTKGGAVAKDRKDDGVQARSDRRQDMAPPEGREPVANGRRRRHIHRWYCHGQNRKPRRLITQRHPNSSRARRSAPCAEERLVNRPSGRNPRPKHRRPAFPSRQPESAQGDHHFGTRTNWAKQSCRANGRAWKRQNTPSSTSHRSDESTCTHRPIHLVQDKRQYRIGCHSPPTGVDPMMAEASGHFLERVANSSDRLPEVFVCSGRSLSDQRLEF